MCGPEKARVLGLVYNCLDVVVNKYIISYRWMDVVAS